VASPTGVEAGALPIGGSIGLPVTHGRFILVPRFWPTPPHLGRRRSLLTWWETRLNYSAVVSRPGEGEGAVEVENDRTNVTGTELLVEGGEGAMRKSPRLIV
jgi:hypothetical protein